MKLELLESYVNREDNNGIVVSGGTRILRYVDNETGVEYFVTNSTIVTRINRDGTPFYNEDYC